MACLLHIETVVGDIRGDQDHARIVAYPISEWQTSFAPTNQLPPRIEYIQQYSAEEGHQNF